MEILNNMNGHNIDDEIKLLIHNIPDDLSEIEIVRWIYIKLGMLFNYDYRIAGDINIRNKVIDYDSGYISNYQTCTKISEILNKVFSEIGINSKTVMRENEVVIYDYKHTANEVTLSTGEKYLLDLTIDLYLIQSGCQTREFASFDKGDYESISNSKLQAIDEKLGLIKDEYTDKKILDKKSVINGIDYSMMTNDEELIYKIEKIKGLIPLFSGYNESRLFLNKLLNDFNIPFHRFNLIYKKDNTNKLIECIQIFGDENIWYLYAGNSGLIRSDALKLKKMLEHGWYSKNERFIEELDEEINRKNL